MRRITTGLLVCGMICLAAGCSSGPTTYINTDVDFSFIQRVAVFPFANLSPDNQAGMRVQSVFMSQLLEQEGLKVVAMGETRAAVARAGLPLGGELSNSQIVDLGKALKVDAIFFGVVEDYGMEQISSDRNYAVTLTLSLCETTTGKTIWQSQATGTGGSLLRKIFGGGSARIYDVTRKVVAGALGTLF